MIFPETEVRLMSLQFLVILLASSRTVWKASLLPSIWNLPINLNLYSGLTQTRYQVPTQSHSHSPPQLKRGEKIQKAHELRLGQGEITH